mmetsp:Transcript_69561/g.148793  ORF Transcript_69561/g.148793 Transcript_69561/m.148793 type:complete len:149 (-) Transcript_69561:60-506(-)
MTDTAGSSTAPALDGALRSLGEQPWPAQEACYGVLLKLLDNVVKSPDEPKFRSIRRGNAAIKAKVLDCPGGAALLMAAGFLEEPETYVLPAEAPVEVLEGALDSLRAHAEARRQDNFRVERDAKIAQAKAEEAKLAEMGGFARGRHKI